MSDEHVKNKPLVATPKGLFSWSAVLSAPPWIYLTVLLVSRSVRSLGEAPWFLLVDALAVGIAVWQSINLARVVRTQREHGTREGWILIIIALSNVGVLVNGAGTLEYPPPASQPSWHMASYAAWSVCLLIVLANIVLLRRVAAPWWSWVSGLDFAVVVFLTITAAVAGNGGTPCLAFWVGAVARTWGYRVLLLNGAVVVVLIWLSWRSRHVPLEKAVVPLAASVALFVIAASYFWAGGSAFVAGTPNCEAPLRYFLMSASAADGRPVANWAARSRYRQLDRTLTSTSARTGSLEHTPGR